MIDLEERGVPSDSECLQKSWCNDLCQVAVLKELVNGTFERDFTKASNASVWDGFFIKSPKGIAKNSLQKNLPERCLHTALKPFLVGLFRAPF